MLIPQPKCKLDRCLCRVCRFNYSKFFYYFLPPLCEYYPQDSKVVKVRIRKNLWLIYHDDVKVDLANLVSTLKVVYSSLQSGFGKLLSCSCDPMCDSCFGVFKDYHYTIVPRAFWVLYKRPNIEVHAESFWEILKWCLGSRWRRIKALWRWHKKKVYLLHGPFLKILKELYNISLERAAEGYHFLSDYIRDFKR